MAAFIFWALTEPKSAPSQDSRGATDHACELSIEETILGLITNPKKLKPEHN